MKEKIILCAAGTGGHVFPALALLEQIGVHGAFILTDSRGAAYCRDIRPESVTVLDAPNRLPRSPIALGIFLYKSYRVACNLWKKWRKDRPAAVVGFGGCATFVPVFLAWSLKIPTIIHEQNALMGKANRLLSRIVKGVALSFPETKKVPKPGKAQHIGMPIRARFTATAPQPFKEQDDWKICVLGGSQGARILSSVVPRAVALLPEALRKRLVIKQQAGEDEVPFVEAFYQVHGVRAHVFSFSDAVDQLMRDVHLVICRAGASTLAEAAALARPVLMIPYPYAMDDHQVRNASFYADRHAGCYLLEKDFSPRACAAFLEKHLRASSPLEEMGQAMHTLAKGAAAEKLWVYIESLCHRR